MLRKRASLVAVLSAALLIALAVAAYGYDTTRDDLIADGVTVAGVDVGGMRADDAADKLRSTLGPGLERPVRVAAAGRRFRLTAERGAPRRRRRRHGRRGARGEPRRRPARRACGAD